MAYNPFDFFRKNQKVLFAGLTVVVMFMFVLSFGRGDFFDWLPRFVGSTQPHGEVMAVIDGDRIWTSELDKVRDHRKVANRFMYQGLERSMEQAQLTLMEKMANVSQANRQTIQNGWQYSNLYMSLLQQGKGSMVKGMIDDPMRQLDELANNSAQPQDDRIAARSLATIMRLTPRLNRKQNSVFFNNQPMTSRRDDLEFVLWQKKADSLGIRFTTKDLANLIKEELPAFQKAEQEKIAQELIQPGRKIYRDTIDEALIEEFRVLTAQRAVLGAAEVRRSAEPATIPYDLYTYYRNETTPHTYAFISVPFELFESKVTGQPTEVELYNIFNTTRGYEPNPESARFGIREPRRLKMEWLEAKGEEPFYKAAGADWLKKADAFTRLSGLLMQPALGSSTPAMATVAAYTWKLDDPLYKDAYAEYRRDFSRSIEFNWYQLRDNVRVLDTSLIRPQTIASMVGLSGLAMAGGPSPFPLRTPLVVTETEAIIHEKHARIQSVLPLLASPLMPTVAEFAAAANSHGAALPQAFPLATVKPMIAPEVARQLQYDVCRADLTHLQEEIQKLHNNKDKNKNADARAAEAKTKINEFISSRGLKRGASEQLQSVYTIESDPGLMVLKDRLQGPHGSMMNAKFGRRFFFEDGPMNPRTGERGPEKPTSGLYDPQPYPNNSISSPQFMNDSQFLVWRSEDVPAKSPASFEAAREKCVKVWRLMKARELAKAAAEELSAKLSGKAGQEILQEQTEFARAYNNPQSSKRSQYFELQGVSPIVIEAQSGSRPSVIARPFQLAPGKELPYPSEKMRNDLLALNNKPRGTSTVLVDGPETTYYVAVLIVTSPPGEFQFQQRIFPELENDASRQIRESFAAKSHAAIREEAVALLKAEFRYEKEHEKLNEKTSEKTDSE